jgi:hypothetical protein
MRERHIRSTPGRVYRAARRRNDRARAVRGLASGKLGARQPLASADVRRHAVADPRVARGGVVAGIVGAFLTPAAGPRYSAYAAVVTGFLTVLILAVLVAELIVR